MNARILIVDDEPNIRHMFRTSLEVGGCTVVEAADGSEALARMQESPIDLALVDLRMPGMSGMELLRHLKAVGCEIPVVVVTAHGVVPEAVEAMKLGAIDFLVKPLRPDLLRQLVAQVMSTHARRALVQAPASPEPAVTIQVASPELARARNAIEFRAWTEAERLLCILIEKDVESAEAYFLLGTLREQLNEFHAAYHSFKAVLAIDRGHALALQGLKRYCERFGLDHNDPLINPAAR